LRHIAEEPDLQSEAARRLIGKTPPTGNTGRALNKRLILAAALLLAAGIAVPVLAGATAEIILTNELAIAALVVAVAAMLRS
jgi:hypothetical protein